jgi:mRNA interferase MazF
MNRQMTQQPRRSYSFGRRPKWRQPATSFLKVTASRVKGYPFEVALPEGSGVVGVVLADQLKSLDWRARKVKLIERASSDVLAMVTARIQPLLVPDNPATL